MQVGAPISGPLAGRDWLAAAVLAAVAIAVFFPALQCPFVNYDDPEYVTNNPHVTTALTPANMRWAFSTSWMANWHPLTWLSLQLDASLWKLDPRGYHLSNVLLHAANVALTFLILRSATGALGPSAAVALLFAVHPLRVEPVAWVAERKGVLSVFFGLLALWAYVGYARSPNARRYLLVAVALALSLMSKPALVTFPFLALVLDWWPLGRAANARDWRRLVLEKVPLLVLIVAFSVIAYLTQSGGGALGGLDMFPLAVRLKNAVVGYVMYLYLTIYPVNLAILYPHAGAALPLEKVLGSLLVLLLVTAAAVMLRRRAPYLLTGWLWYLGTLVPVIGLVQVGGAGYADRYVYFPHIGLLLALCWGARDLLAAWPRLATATAVAAAVALSIGSYRQLETWRDSISLWRHDLDVAGKYPKGLNNLGEALLSAGRDNEAVPYFRETLQQDPNYGEAYANLGNVAYRHGRMDEAATAFEQAIRFLPKQSTAYSRYARVELTRNKIDHAIALFRQALLLDSNSAEAHSGLGLALTMCNKVDEGLVHLREAVRCDPGDVLAHVFLANILERQGDVNAAAAHLEEATRLAPGEPVYWQDLGRVRQRQGRTAEANQCLKRAAELESKKGSG
jgi:tetratricopeptide (TPR) repeat protein